jgi:hypothetical protein
MAGKPKRDVVNEARGKNGVKWLNSVRKDGGASEAYNRDAQTGDNKFVRSNGNPAQRSSSYTPQGKDTSALLNTRANRLHKETADYLGFDKKPSKSSASRARAKAIEDRLNKK